MFALCSMRGNRLAANANPALKYKNMIVA
jgi:hypothetical protein